MAHKVVYISPGELYPGSFDFTGILPSTDAALNSASTVTATKSDGTNATGLISNISSATALTVSCDLQGVTHGEDYTVIFSAKGSTSLKVRHQILELRVRTNPPSSL